ncbi:hypothetical protein H4219_003094 [Mycoemilia scoparia]|uniref:RNA helicase n=1 Tax=Mycoemilia scoparia TaxID=417184 RepID=A0A9W7ZZN5_9FUNG|nr:hypothetical protein H4219_003094 [Mycoemilia scoparia]
MSTGEKKPKAKRVFVKSKKKLAAARSSGGRAGRGKATKQRVQARKAEKTKQAFVQATKEAGKQAKTKLDKLEIEAKLQLKRSQTLRKNRAPGLGFTPARFRLLPIESDLCIIKRANGQVKMKIKATDLLKAKGTLKEYLESVNDFSQLGLLEDVSGSVESIIREQKRTRHHIRSDAPVEVKPTPIQALAIPEFSSSTSFKTEIDDSKPKQKSGQVPDIFMAAETGSGKTYAYLLPIISRIKEAEQAMIQATPNGSGENSAVDLRDKKQVGYSETRKPGTPYAVIMVPSRNLVTQLMDTIKTLSHTAKFSSAGVHLGLPRTTIKKRLALRPVDVIVGTPSAIQEYATQDQMISLGEVSHIVIDEADTIIDDDSFRKDAIAVIEASKNAAQTNGIDTRLVYVSATMPKIVCDKIYDMSPNLVHIATPSLHKALPRLSQTFVDVGSEFQGSKNNALWQVLRSNTSDRRTIIFCNRKTTAAKVHKLLVSAKFPALLIAGEVHNHSNTANENQNQNDNDGASNSRQMSKDKHKEKNTVKKNNKDADEKKITREEILEAFINNDPIPNHLIPEIIPEKPMYKKYSKQNEDFTQQYHQQQQQQNKQKVLVCTDILSRGVDTLGVSHVILYDFPTTAIDYLHRCGRTARAGSKGKVTALVTKRDRRLATMIRLAIKQGAVIS